MTTWQITLFAGGVIVNVIKWEFNQVPMAKPHHKLDEKVTCEIVGCKEIAERSINAKAVENAELSVSESAEKRAHLCKKHYREYKKKTKKDRELERLGW